ncbi:Histidine kinase- DNA gyrase B- and HSP90-like ATPase family protein [Euphorbia peplus]|nr:Histidine kinase- DNA gyrase B- and HSP90-like ATPase family protein [Euphorbia peplus]
MEAVKLESDGGLRNGNFENVSLPEHKRSMVLSGKKEFVENRSSTTWSTCQSGSSVLEQGQSPVDDTGISSATTICPAPLCRQFWKAGSYSDTNASKVNGQSVHVDFEHIMELQLCFAAIAYGKNYLHVHPMFLHSNATSHKWAFGAIAELLDNAVDEIQNGANFVLVDKTVNPRDGSSALLIQDDGGGMDPEAMRHCMSFGYSDKKSKSAIGQYGNGFKTSTMRLGGDAIVFSCHKRNSVKTRSIGLLSYTFLSRMGYDRIVVPMVDYEFNNVTRKWEIHHLSTKEHFVSNFSMLLQWSPYSTEEELLDQFEDIRDHGTKVIIYNLWLSDDGNAELDFDTDAEDIRISGDKKKAVARLTADSKTANEQHISNRLHYSLKVYLSILYLRIPENFQIILRGRVVPHHNLANDLKFEQFILYKPQCGGVREGQVITTIGFVKEAPLIHVHGFNVYHKNRLILPFWPVVSYADSRGRGVVGILEANFIEPTHNKQEFERTSLFQKLEARLKEMTWEYWDFHCGLIGYLVKKKHPTSEPKHKQSLSMPNVKTKPVKLNQNSPVILDLTGSHSEGLCTKRKAHNDLVEYESLKRQSCSGVNSVVAGKSLDAEPANREAANLLEENKKLKEKCLIYEKSKEELDLKETKLKNELAESQREYERLMAELAAVDLIKEEVIVNL